MKIGFLGAGAMGGAILSGAINAGVLDPKQVYVSDMSDKIKEKYAALGCNIVKDNEELGRAADTDYVDGHADELVRFSDLTEDYWAYAAIMEATNGHDYTKTDGVETWTELH